MAILPSGGVGQEATNETTLTAAEMRMMPTMM